MIVAQGDTLSSLASRFGYLSYEPVWNHAENAPLRERRDDPHALLPEDAVRIPAVKPLTFEESTGSEHTYRIVRGQCWLRLRLVDGRGEPRAGVTPLAPT